MKSMQARGWTASTSSLPAVLCLLMVASLVACASGSSGERSSRDSSRISLQELEATRMQNMYDMIERERPRWLLSRPARSFHLDTEIVVAVDGRYYGGIESLREFAPETIREVRYMDGPTATATINGLGSRHVEAAIVLDTRRR
jgi:hypothetical protein